MANAGEWVRQILASSQSNLPPTVAVWKSLEKYVGLGDKALGRVQDIQRYIDEQLIDHKGGREMRELWAVVIDYLEKVQEAAAAAA